MVETRTDTIVARERGQRVETWHPDRDRLDVSVGVEGDAIVALVGRTRACTLALGERRKVVTQIDKSADTTMLVVEGLAGAWLMGVGAKIGDSREVGGLGIIPFAIGAAFGAGFVYDLTAGSKETAERTEVVQTGVRESPACETGAGAGSVVSFAIAGGPSLSCTTAADGSCQVTIAADTWQASGGTLVVNVSVDGRLLRHEELKKTAP